MLSILNALVRNPHSSEVYPCPNLLSSKTVAFCSVDARWRVRVVYPGTERWLLPPGRP